ncbi:MAG TPA: hypothetical protein DCQ30_08170 [Acidimicrobiaceae bacterium]|nr:hypothetical protein [Acidimicrobiaceae bacterium]
MDQVTERARRAPGIGRRILPRLAAVGLLAGAVAVVHGAIGASASSTTATTTYGATQATGVNASSCPGSKLLPHPPISITSDAGFTVANGVTGGSGTTSNPYIISCWSIALSGSQTAIAIGPPTSTIDVSFTIRDVSVSGGTTGTGISIQGPSPGITGNVTLEDDSISESSAIFTEELQGGTAILNNLLQDPSTGINDNSDVQLTIAQNAVTNVAGLCMNITSQAPGSAAPVTTLALVQDNTCTGRPGSSVGIAAEESSTTTTGGSGANQYLSPDPGQIDITGNDIEGFTGPGLGDLVDATVTGNKVDGNSYGVGIISGLGHQEQDVIIQGNDIENNKNAGIDMTQFVDSVISNNTILHNGTAGIVAENAQEHDQPTAANNLIEGNTIGDSDFGIAFSFDATNDTVYGNHWADGHESYVRFADTQTVVDAGSAVRGVAGSPTNFADWIVHVVPGSIAPSSCSTTTGCTGTTALAGATGATYSFGDGTSQNITPAQFTNTGALLSHIYSATGTYSATMTVHATDSAGNPVTLTSSTPVTIASPTPTTSLFSQAGNTTPWPMIGNTPDRPFYNANETQIDSSTVNQLVQKWRFPTTYPVTASPAVGQVNLPPVTGGTPVPTTVIYDGSFDGTFYAINDATGLPVWQECLVTSSVYVTSQASCDPSYPGNPNAQTDYGVVVASPEVATLSNGSQEVLAAANATMNALNPATGQVLWSFTGGSYVQADAGTTGASVVQTCVPPGTSGATAGSPYDIESSPVVVGNTVYFGMDSNAECDQAGGIYALNATTGAMEWFFDPAAGEAFYPCIGVTTTSTPCDSTTFNAVTSSTNTTSWDPHYDLVNGKLAPGYTCGGVWTSPAVDVVNGLLFASSANCPTDPIPPYMEAAFALNMTSGEPVWDYLPRQVDSIDMDFGATPNVFQLGSEHVVGYASKDGTYTLLDDETGKVLWSTKVALGGSFGGFYNAVVDGNDIYLNSALGEASGFAATPVEDTEKGREFALDARTGNVVWRSYAGAPNLGQNAAVNGVYFTGGLDGFLHAFSTQSGQLLGQWPLGVSVSSGPAIYSGELFIGSGTGATVRSAAGASADPAFGGQPAFPNPMPIYPYGQGLSGFCVATNPSCSNAVNKIDGGRDTTSVTYTGATSGTVDQPVTFSANLEDNTVSASPNPVSNRSVTFSITPNGQDGASASYTQSCEAFTDANGNASCSITLDQPAGTSTISTVFSGDSTYQPTSTTTQFTVNAAPTTLKYSGDTSVADGGSGNLSAVLTETSSGNAIEGRAVVFTLGSGSSAQSCTGMTDSTGTAACQIDPVIQPLGSGRVSATFAGDSFYSPSSAGAAVSCYAYTGSSGAFVIGNGNAAVGNSVTFWSNGWGSANTVSGGNAAGSGFKGYATTPNPSPPVCGGTWTSPTGNSSPPGSVPPYMAVAVSSDITLPNSTTARGNVVEIVVIATNPGYTGKLNQPGTGTVLGVICKS